MHRTFRLAAAVILTACTSRANVPDAGVTVDDAPAEPSSRRPLVILRTSSYQDPGLASRRLGRLEIVVRSADRPAQSVAQGLVRIRAGEQGATTERLADERGIARFDSIAVGRYQVLVRAIGYGSATLVAPVSPGCRTDVETYIGIQAIGIAPPPPEPGRSVITTCRPER
jgi:hypothetical protein